eukprot:g5375.t1
MKSMNRNLQVRFNAQGKILTIDYEVLMNQPESYLAWLAQSSVDSLEQGIPIEINRPIEAVRRMLEAYSMDSSSSSTYEHNNTTSFQSNEMTTKEHRSHEGSGSMRTKTLPSEMSGAPPPPHENDVLIQDAVRDVLHVLKQCRKWGHLHDKAIFVLRWGRSSNCDRVLRPYTVKMYESLTGMLYDVRSSSDFHGMRNLNPSASGFSSIISAQTATFICSSVQELITERIRDAGYSCSFVDIGVNENGVLLWKNQGTRNHSTNAINGTVRCLVVNTR